MGYFDRKNRGGKPHAAVAISLCDSLHSLCRTRTNRRRLEHGFSHLFHCCDGLASSASVGYDLVVHAVGLHSGVVAVPAAPGGGH